MTTLHRFFVPPDEAIGDRFPTPPSIRRQVERVLRLRDGDHVVLLTGDGYEARCRLEDGACVVEERRAVATEPAHRLTVVQALLKGDGLEEVVDRGTELGVAAFELMVTDRSIARGLTDSKIERLRTIAREAAARAERAIVPNISGPVAFDATLNPDTILLHARGGSMRLMRHRSTQTRLAIGPEGGFTDDEVQRAIASGVIIVGLGPRIMRARSAGAVAAAIVLSTSGDLG